MENTTQTSITSGIKPASRVLRYLPGEMSAALTHFYAKLGFETDSADVYEDLQEGITDFIVVDARSQQSYAIEHIPGAIHLPHKQMNDITTGILPRDKVIVVYCDGIGCNASTKGAAKLTTLGFKVKELIGGLDWWKRDGYPVENGLENLKIASCGCE